MKIKGHNVVTRLTGKIPKTLQKAIPYQYFQSFPGNTKGTSNQYHPAARVVNN